MQQVPLPLLVRVPLLLLKEAQPLPQLLMVPPQLKLLLLKEPLLQEETQPIQPMLLMKPTAFLYQLVEMLPMLRHQMQQQKLRLLKLLQLNY
jgi:hypothetical protein